MPAQGHYVTSERGMLVEFASAVDAARCALEVQRDMAARNGTVPQDTRIEFRIGFYVGDIIIDDDDIFGDASISRLASKALRSPAWLGTQFIRRDTARVEAEAAALRAAGLPSG